MLLSLARTPALLALFLNLRGVVRQCLHHLVLPGLLITGIPSLLCGGFALPADGRGSSTCPPPTQIVRDQLQPNVVRSLCRQGY